MQGHLEIQECAVQKEKERIMQEYADKRFDGFRKRIMDAKQPRYTPTGFEKLDKILGGGLRNALYVVGAVSSLGKTTLMLQIADQMAANGRDVLIFSLETVADELMAKSVSRETFLAACRNKERLKDAKSYEDILTGENYAGYSSAEKELIEQAMGAYAKYHGNIRICDMMEDPGIERISREIKAHVCVTGKKPVVIIDYIQIAARVGNKATEKLNMDDVVVKLKNIALNLQLPVIGISSFNRAGYNGMVTMEAFKESGMIEYSCDILIGLQFKGAGKKDFDIDRAKARFPREIEVVILKNKGGDTSVKVDMKYYQLYNYFKEA